MQRSLGATSKSFSSYCWYRIQLGGIKGIKIGLICYLNITAGISKKVSLIRAATIWLFFTPTHSN
jgi:hypothetical protein